MAKLSLNYPSLNPGGSILGLVARIKAAKRKNLPKSGGGGRRWSEDRGQIQELRLERDLYNDLYKRERDVVSDKKYIETRNIDIGKFQYSQIKDAQDREKQFVHKWIELYHKAGDADNPALQANLMEGFMDYEGRLGKESKALIAPILRTGPFSKTAQRIAQFEKISPEPKITASSEEPTILAKQLTQHEKWRAKLQGVATGKIGPVRELIPLGEGLYVHTEGGGQIVDEETLGLKDQAKAAGVPYLKYLADGGAWGTSTNVVSGGVEHTIAPFRNLKGEVDMREISKKRLPENKDLHNFMSQWAGWEELDVEEKKKQAGSITADVHRRIDGGQDMITISKELLKPRFGMNFIKVEATPDRTEKLKPWTWFSEATYKLRAVPGELFDMLGYAVYYDTHLDRVFNAKTGDEIGTYIEAMDNMRRARSRQKTKIYQGSFE